MIGSGLLREHTRHAPESAPHLRRRRSPRRSCWRLLAARRRRAPTGFRCGTKLIVEGATRGEVDRALRRADGRRSAAAILRRPVFWRFGRPYYLSDDLVEVPVETWTYNLGPAQAGRDACGCGRPRPAIGERDRAVEGAARASSLAAELHQQRALDAEEVEIAGEPAPAARSGRAPRRARAPSRRRRRG
jgi:hypothetical protein